MSKILSATQLRQADQYTIEHEPVTSINLMERAAGAAYSRLCELYLNQEHYTIFCGIGNNGGDGLVLARLFFNAGKTVDVHIIEFSDNYSQDFKINLDRLLRLGISPTFHNNNVDVMITSDTLIVDAMLGTGVTRKMEGVLARASEIINNSGAPIVAIDLPSGLFDSNNTDDNRSVAVKATHTLTFQTLKYCFMMPENHNNIGVWSVLDIGLSKEFIDQVPSSYTAVDEFLIDAHLKPRNPFSHKGTHGHALICAGSKNMMGAALMTSKSCLRSGVGLLTVLVPNCGYEIVQMGIPEAMALTSAEEDFLTPIKINFNPNSIGVGPGIGTNDSCKKLMYELFSRRQSMVVDADALNIVSADPSLLNAIPEKSIITPHPKEFDRLFGFHNDTNSRIHTALRESKNRKITIVLKGHHTATVTQTGQVYFNLSGNAGMATGGSGDVLTGLITGLFAQGYTSEYAAIIGVYIHGSAGDIAAAETGQEALIASDIIENIGAAFQRVHQE